MPRKAKKIENEGETPIKKALGLFDHLKHIRGVQTKDYYDKLTEDDQKSFNQFMLLKLLSMDRDAIDNVCSMAKYYDIVPDRNFYQMSIAMTPRKTTYVPYIKSNNKSYNVELLKLLSKWYECSTLEANEYCKLLLSRESGINEIRSVCKAYGLTDKEVTKLMKHE